MPLRGDQCFILALLGLAILCNLKATRDGALAEAVRLWLVPPTIAETRVVTHPPCRNAVLSYVVTDGRRAITVCCELSSLCTSVTLGNP